MSAYLSPLAAGQGEWRDAVQTQLSETETETETETHRHRHTDADTQQSRTHTRRDKRPSCHCSRLARCRCCTFCEWLSEWAAWSTVPSSTEKEGLRVCQRHRPSACVAAWKFWVARQIAYPPCSPTPGRAAASWTQPRTRRSMSNRTRSMRCPSGSWGFLPGGHTAL